MNNTDKSTGKRKKSSSDNSKEESAKLALLAEEATAASSAAIERMRIHKEIQEAQDTLYYKRVAESMRADRIDHENTNKFSHLHYKELRASTRGGKQTKYKRSEKRFKNGKKTMVIYLGKRGGEYVRTKGVYVSLTKFKKMLDKAKK
jgi:hypothetical protein